MAVLPETWLARLEESRVWFARLLEKGHFRVSKYHCTHSMVCPMCSDISSSLVIKHSLSLVL